MLYKDNDDPYARMMRCLIVQFGYQVIDVIKNSRPDSVEALKLKLYIQANRPNVSTFVLESIDKSLVQHDKFKIPILSAWLRAVDEFNAVYFETVPEKNRAIPMLVAFYSDERLDDLFKHTIQANPDDTVVPALAEKFRGTEKVVLNLIPVTPKRVIDYESMPWVHAVSGLH
ncbi:unnamed protein product [Peronospora belbahrii]|uniref:Uncharacterized protein n=1 Tax=Peronospora belbahrii TaxID=622444 RepID=A0AAU9L9V8_9STRA|nr:unnamed protein product [Peronospora belbahrii]